MDGYYIGLMTGSSADAVDAAMVHLRSGHPELVDSLSSSLPHHLQQQLVDIQHGQALDAAEFCRLHAGLGELYAESCEILIRQSGIAHSDIQAIGCHGQTLCHLPRENPPGTWQIGDPAQIAEGLFWGGFINNGQTCAAMKRLYVHEDVYVLGRRGVLRARRLSVV